jgi:2-hydroxy-3-oxopropionate reductase
VSDVAFIGLGIMGRPMAGHLIAAGHQLHLYARNAVPDDLLERGGQRWRSPAEAASHAEIVVTMLPDTPDVEQVLFGKSGAVGGLSAGKLVIDMSSISPLDTRRLAARINQLGCDYLDAPVSGGDVGARDATLTIMVGGPEPAFERARPLFEKMGKNVTRVGDNGDGQICKVANQIIVALNIQAVGEGLLFASRMGANPARVRQALMGGFASSRVLELHGERMVKRDFTPGARIELHQKDLGIALATARSMGIPLPGTAVAQEMFNACVAHGGKGWDHSALVRALEVLAAHEIGS